jgi:uncharacterized repeat protein (TIGR04076 family)
VTTLSPVSDVLPLPARKLALSAPQCLVLRGPGAICSLLSEGITELYDLRVTVERIDGRSVCGLEVGDWFELTESNRLRIPEGKHFCVFALQSVLPFLAAKQRALADGDWLEQDSLFACPDPDERVILRVERTGRRRLPTSELT